jgi:hypothetical protein
MRNPWAGLHCAECRRLVRALEMAWRADNQELRARLRLVAESSGRDASEFGVGWVFSIARMPDDEMRALLDSHYPQLAEVKRRSQDHETATGHSLKAWWMASNYMAL